MVTISLSDMKGQRYSQSTAISTFGTRSDGDDDDGKNAVAVKYTSWNMGDIYHVYILYLKKILRELYFVLLQGFQHIFR